MTERVVTLQLTNVPNYNGTPKAYPEGVIVYTGSVSAISIPYLSQTAVAAYGKVLSYLFEKYGSGVSLPNSVSFVTMKMKVPNANWQKRKKAGEIVFANYKAGKLRGGFTNRKSYVETLTLIPQSGRTPLPFQIGPKPLQKLTRYNSLGTNPGLMTTDKWIAGEGNLPSTFWTHNIIVDDRLPYDEHHLRAKLTSLNYGKNLIDNGLVTQTLAQLNGKELDLLTEVAEIAKTCQTIGNTLRAILNLILSFKAAIRHVTGPGSLKRIAEMWLELRYGIRPLIYSAEASLKILQELGNKSKYIESRKKKTITRPSPLNQDIQETLTLRCLIRRQYKYSDLIGELGSKFISADPIVTAWELTALSFVVDWVFDIGSFLSAIGTFTPISFQQNAVFSIKAECNGSTSKEYLEYEVYTRYIIQPETHITIPVQFNLDLFKLMDLIALTRTVPKDIMDLKKRNNNAH